MITDNVLRIMTHQMGETLRYMGDVVLRAVQQRLQRRWINHLERMAQQKAPPTGADRA